MMATVDQSEVNQMHEFGADFGNFYPRGHVMAAFSSDDDAKAAQRRLEDAGWTPEDCRYMSAAKVVEGTDRGIQSAGLSSMLGASLKLVTRYNDLAKQGCSFLLIKADSSDKAEQVRALIGEFSPRTALLYHLLAVEEMY